MTRHTGGKDAGFQAWQLFTLAGLISASAVAFRAGNQSSSVRVALILTVFGAALMGIAALRALFPLAGRHDTFEPPIVGSRTRVGLEREKLLALRTIKELEFDRAMGKISEKDYAEMSERLRARAARILRELDANSGYRDEIEHEIARRIAASSGTAVAPAAVDRSTADIPPPDTPQPPSAAPVESPASVCQDCGTRNDVDARFCKSCGRRMDVV